ncbi:hypothetical protein LUZ61_018063 [Rhynchospora tenuis]|uniref:Uncharacterized protein n=1 Tax=Rhynchospora tenuis TaxID=198213 RepID=A0AAD5Z8I1_9POAL|nr:hypothetical protein LUZ61_018063 [Rhynchospora tenuis]
MGLGDNAYSYSEHDHLAADGTNIGASMTVRRVPQLFRSNECICINIHVNNNIQGVTNSVLLGSKVVMRDPGARVSLNCDEMDGQDQDMRIGQVGHSFRSLWGQGGFWFGLIFSVLVVVVACTYYVQKNGRTEM